MSGMYRRVILPSVVLAMLTACGKVQTANQIQTHRLEHMTTRPWSHLTAMSNNGIVHNMAVADHHFVPHTAELSSCGLDVLDRMAVVLTTYGGTVHYETDSADQAMIDERIDHVREYLAMAGCEMDRVEVVAGLSVGRGMPAADAVKDAEEGTEASTETATQRRAFISDR